MSWLEENKKTLLNQPKKSYYNWYTIVLLCLYINIKWAQAHFGSLLAQLMWKNFKILYTKQNISTIIIALRLDRYKPFQTVRRRN